ncbi:unnamed protein product [Coccothraustes coccothraustes]
MQPPTDPKQKCVKRGREGSCQRRSISSLGARVPVVRCHCLTPGQSGAVANHKHIGISLPSLLITLRSEKKKEKKQREDGKRLSQSETS